MIRKKNGLKNALAPKKGLDSINRRIIFKREVLSSFINISNLLLAIILAIKRYGLLEHIRLLRL